MVKIWVSRCAPAQAGRFEVLALRDIDAHEELTLCFGQIWDCFFFFKISPGNIQGLSFQQKIRDPTKNIQQKR